MSDPEPVGFDALDTALGEHLRAAAPDAGDPDAVLTTLRPRLTRARQRRRVGLAAAGAAVAAAVAGLLVVVRDPGAEVRVPPADRPSVTVAPGPSGDATVPTSVPAPPPPATDRSGTGDDRDDDSDERADDRDDDPDEQDDDPDDPDHPDDQDHRGSG